MGKVVRREAASGRASAEAIEKRRVARQLNSLFGGEGESGKLDGRTEKRRQRLLKELKEGRSGQPLKPIEIVVHANELLLLGETVASIRKNGVKAPKVELSANEETVECVRRAQEAYGFRPEAWKLLGIDFDEFTTARGTAKRPVRRTRQA
jgi:hypothetical protein